MDPNKRQALMEAMQSRGMVGGNAGPGGMDTGRMMMAGRQMGGGAGQSQGPIDQLKISQPEEAVLIVKALAARLKALTEKELGQEKPAQPAAAPAMA